MAFEFLMLQMIPNFLIGVPIRRVSRKMKNMQPPLPLDESGGLVGRMRWGLIHHYHQVTAWMVLQ
jgi:hypothetical protein